MSNINAVSNNYIVPPNQVNSNNDPLSLGSQDFMELMMVQLQNQDPMNPMDNTEYISQMAEFSALEQMQNMNSSLTTMYAFGLMGKEVTLDAGNGTSISGLVETVSMKNGIYYLEVDGVQYNASLVKGVSQPNTDKDTDDQETTEEVTE